MLLHGLFGALSNFQEVRAHFSKSFRVITPMLPIYELPMLETNAKNMAKHIAGFLDELGLDKVHLLGNSLGGHVGLIYTRDHLDRVASLTLTASSGLYENAFGSSFPRREDKSYIKDKVAVTFHDPKHATPELVDECFEAVNDRNKVLRILSIAKSAIRHNMAKDLAFDECAGVLDLGQERHHHAARSGRGIPGWISGCGLALDRRMWPRPHDGAPRHLQPNLERLVCQPRHFLIPCPASRLGN